MLKPQHHRVLGWKKKNNAINLNSTIVKVQLHNSQNVEEHLKLQQTGGTH